MREFGQILSVGGIPVTDRSCLVMDEVDGMSAGDRGGVGALNALIKKTKVTTRPSLHGRETKACTDSYHMYCKRSKCTENETTMVINV
jgi:hypothetical protein